MLLRTVKMTVPQEGPFSYFKAPPPLSSENENRIGLGTDTPMAVPHPSEAPLSYSVRC